MNAGLRRENRALDPKLGRARSVAVVVLALLGCGGGNERPELEAGSDPSCPGAYDLAFVPDTAGMEEAYVCYGFDAARLGNGTIGGARWRIARDDAAYLIHHAIVYALAGDFPDGPVVCDEMPAGATQLHVWSPGGNDLQLPPDTALALPDGTRRLLIQVHTLKLGAADAKPSSLTLCRGPDAPRNLAALMGFGAPVPAIRPQHEESSTGSCALADDLHLDSVWPHMHLVGKSISSELIDVNGLVTPLVAVDDWDFHRQKTYPIDVDARAGDIVQVSCVWNNPTDEYVLPGPKTSNEMCNAAFIAWPASAAHCY